MEIEVEFGGVEIEVKVKGLRGLVTLVGLGLAAAAVAQELARPPRERTWHGRLAGAIPYDFRPPTWERLVAAFWDPDDPRLFVDRPLGIGWSLNLAALVRRVT